ncbi:hypothetical protein EYF80_015463 [Liparis tanakae]|uniref:Uncharacterized protein n=1 Tax=Liparis tanakae TaxID=230148 RepID=A0A4Z2I8L7_9TELE|nr:hypothetical protein EYF80_015463 [Liparis tanakae]
MDLRRSGGDGEVEGSLSSSASRAVATMLQGATTIYWAVVVLQERRGDDTFLSRLVSCCVCAGTWQSLPSIQLPLPLLSTTRHPSSSPSASRTAPSLRHLHMSSSLGQSIKLNPCLG